MDQLLKEIDRIAETTEFNGMKLLTAPLMTVDIQIMLGVKVMDYSENTISGKYMIRLEQSGWIHFAGCSFRLQTGGYEG